MNKADESLWRARLNQPRGITSEQARQQRERLKQQDQAMNTPRFKSLLQAGDAAWRRQLWELSLARAKDCVAYKRHPQHFPGVLVRLFNGVDGATIKHQNYLRLPSRARPYLYVAPPACRQRADGPHWEMVF